SREVLRLPRHDLPNPELDNRSRTEIAGHQRGVEGAVRVVQDPPGVSQTVDLGVEEGVVTLDTPVPAPPYDPTIADQHRPYRDPAYSPPRLCLLNRTLHE